MARTTTGTAEASLTAALQPVIRTLVTDMRSRLTEDAALLQSWKTEYTRAQDADRVGTSFQEWSEEQLQQAAAGWVLTTVFLRFIEDNDLFGPRQVFLTGHNPERRALGRDYEAALYQEHPEYSYRAYLQHCFNQLAEVPATKDLVGPHAAIHIIEPSDDAARTIIEFFRTVDTTEDGEQSTRWTFNDPELSTRFLGDLYQDLSEFARKKYALLQTPDFVEEFILDRTLTPALEERPLEGFTLIDPTCGSGHFLLGAFHRLVTEWEKHAPAMPAPERAEKAMQAIHGVDINPFAVAISQFRLTVAYMLAAGDARLTERESKPGFTVLAGDSLLFGPDAVGQGALNLQAENFVYSTENADALDAVLTPGTYDVVVGNPPYITVKDKALNRQYRNRCGKYLRGEYVLSVPFMVKFFQLGKDGNSGQNAGWVGQITSNSFMQRQYGKPLIEQYFGEVDIREVIDTSGAYIPGHGTPTVILIGRHSHPSRRKVIGVLGIQGEPGAPKDPSNGAVWSTIVKHIDQIGYEDAFIGVAELSRKFITEHPWSLQGGATIDTSAAIDAANRCTLGSILTMNIGYTESTGADSAYSFPESYRNSHQFSHLKKLAAGTSVRDYRTSNTQLILFPYSSSGASDNPTSGEFEYYWNLRKTLSLRSVFGRTLAERNLPWYEFREFYRDRFASALSIAYAEISTSNHFIVNRKSALFNQTSPLIVLNETATEDDHLQLLGVLNSSTACFWLKQNNYQKGGDPIGSDGARVSQQPWSDRYQFASTTLKKFPLPDLTNSDVTERGRRLDSLAQELATYEPAAVFTDDTPTQETIEKAEANYARIRRLMIAEQEELDWAVYHLYGLTERDMSLPVGTVDGIELGVLPGEVVNTTSGMT